MQKQLSLFFTTATLIFSTPVAGQSDVAKRTAELRAGSPHTFVEGCNKLQSCVEGMKNGHYYQLTTQQILDGWDHCKESLLQKMQKNLEFPYSAMISQPIDQRYIDVEELLPGNQYYTGHLKGYVRTSRNVYRFFCDFSSAGWIKKTEVIFDAERR